MFDFVFKSIKNITNHFQFIKLTLNFSQVSNYVNNWNKAVFRVTELSKYFQEKALLVSVCYS